MNVSGQIKLIGGEPCLDFVNTIHDRNEDASADYIAGGYEALIKWEEYAGILKKEQSVILLIRSRQELSRSETVYKNAIRLRNNLFDIFSSIADGTRISSANLSVFNTFISGAFGHKQIVSIKDGYADEWDSSGYPLDMVLWPLISSAHRLILNNNHKKIKKCPSCSWLFIDHSKPGKRVWCSMDTCGALDKARRYYHRKKSS
jgi:predicted RNA-binding Zn ribbon-like protein